MAKAPSTKQSAPTKAITILGPVNHDQEDLVIGETYDIRVADADRLIAVGAAALAEDAPKA